MALFAISDTHLAYAVNKPMDIFGDRWVNHGKKIEWGWEDAGITDEDTICIPGDISWAMKLEEAYPDFEFLHNLKGTKIIGRGNHDLWWDTDTKVMRMFEDNGFNTLKLLRNNAVETDEHIICGSRGWYMDEKNSPSDADFCKIVAREAIRLEMSLSQGTEIREQSGNEKEIIVFMHFPPIFNDYICYEFIDLFHKYDVTRCYYGHIHSVYSIERKIVFENITFEIISADFLHFIPLKI